MWTGSEHRNSCVSCRVQGVIHEHQGKASALGGADGAKHGKRFAQKAITGGLGLGVPQPQNAAPLAKLEREAALDCCAEGRWCEIPQTFVKRDTPFRPWCRLVKYPAGAGLGLGDLDTRMVAEVYAGWPVTP